MTLLGKGALVIWHDVQDESEYNDWTQKSTCSSGSACRAFAADFGMSPLRGRPGT